VVVGHLEECLDALDAAWIRRALPQDGDSDHSRWLTDPIWKIAQGASFADARRLIRPSEREMLGE
jgi:hypothetical protein